MLTLFVYMSSINVSSPILLLSILSMKRTKFELQHSELILKETFEHSRVAKKTVKILGTNMCIHKGADIICKQLEHPYNGRT